MPEIAMVEAFLVGGTAIPRLQSLNLQEKTRLETRTKESEMYASILVANQIAREIKNAQQHSFAVKAFACRASSSVGPKHTSRDPKDGDLYLSRTKSGETLMEVRRAADVQIAPLT